MSTQTLEVQQVPELRGLNERVTTVEEKVEQNVSAIAETQAKAEIARQAAIDAAHSAADAQIAAEHANHMATEAVDQATRANEVAEEANRNIVAATDELNASVAKIDELEATVNEGEGQIVEFREELDAMQSASDVVDIVDTYAQLQAYDTSKLTDNDVIKVLQDETRDGAITYYRYTKIEGPTSKNILPETTEKLFVNCSYDESTNIIIGNGPGDTIATWYRMMEAGKKYTARITAVDGYKLNSNACVEFTRSSMGMNVQPLEVIPVVFTNNIFEYTYTASNQEAEYSEFTFYPNLNIGNHQYKIELITETGVSPWTYIGSVGPYYTKSEADAKFAFKGESEGGFVSYGKDVNPMERSNYAMGITEGKTFTRIPKGKSVASIDNMAYKDVEIGTVYVPRWLSENEKYLADFKVMYTGGDKNSLASYTVHTVAVPDDATAVKSIQLEPEGSDSGSMEGLYVQFGADGPVSNVDQFGYGIRATANGSEYKYQVCLNGDVTSASGTLEKGDYARDPNGNVYVFDGKGDWEKSGLICTQAILDAVKEVYVGGQALADAGVGYEDGSKEHPFYNINSLYKYRDNNTDLLRMSGGILYAKMVSSEQCLRGDGSDNHNIGPHEIAIDCASLVRVYCYKDDIQNVCIDNFHGAVEVPGDTTSPHRLPQEVRFVGGSNYSSQYSGHFTFVASASDSIELDKCENCIFSFPHDISVYSYNGKNNQCRVYSNGAPENDKRTLLIRDDDHSRFTIETPNVSWTIRAKDSTSLINISSAKKLTITVREQEDERILPLVKITSLTNNSIDFNNNTATEVQAIAWIRYFGEGTVNVSSVETVRASLYTDSASYSKFILGNNVTAYKYMGPEPFIAGE